jgi:hypothetical protein
MVSTPRVLGQRVRQMSCSSAARVRFTTAPHPSAKGTGAGLVRRYLMQPLPRIEISTRRRLTSSPRLEGPFDLVSNTCMVCSSYWFSYVFFNMCARTAVRGRGLRSPTGIPLARIIFIAPPLWSPLGVLKHRIYCAGANVQAQAGLTPSTTPRSAAYRNTQRKNSTRPTRPSLRRTCVTSAA